MQDSVIVKEIPYRSDDYARSLDLRNSVLRKPLGLNLFDENLDKESQDIHIGAFDSNVLVGILILTGKNAKTVQMRQVAVEEAYRGNGIGSKMVLFSEELARKRGYSRLILHARETAARFYEKLGYRAEGSLFYEVGIPHWEMVKVIDEHD